MYPDRRRDIIEMLLLCSQGPLGVQAIRRIFSSARDEATDVTAAQIHESMEQIALDWAEKGLVLSETAGGWQFRTRDEYKNFAAAALREKPPRLSRALLEVLSVIAYHQPATRGDIEQIRGVSVFPNHMRYLEDLGWIKPAGRREVPGRPMTYVTTRTFLDDLGLSSLDELPELEKDVEGQLETDAGGAHHEDAEAAGKGEDAGDSDGDQHDDSERDERAGREDP